MSQGILGYGTRALRNTGKGKVFERQVKNKMLVDEKLIILYDIYYKLCAPHAGKTHLLVEKLKRNLQTSITQDMANGEGKKILSVANISTD